MLKQRREKQQQMELVIMEQMVTPLPTSGTG